MGPFAFALKNLGYRWVTALLVTSLIALLTALGVMATTFSYGLASGIESLTNRLGADIIVVPQGTRTNVESLLLRSAPTTLLLPDGILEKVSHLPYVKRATGQVFVSSLKAQCCAVNVQLIGYDDKHDFLVTPWRERVMAHEAVPPLADDEIIVGNYVFAYPGSTLTFFYKTFKVVDRLAPSGMGFDASVFMTTKAARDLKAIRDSMSQAELDKAEGGAPDPLVAALRAEKAKEAATLNQVQSPSQPGPMTREAILPSEGSEALNHDAKPTTGKTVTRESMFASFEMPSRVDPPMKRVSLPTKSAMTTSSVPTDAISSSGPLSAILLQIEPGVDPYLVTDAIQAAIHPQHVDFIVATQFLSATTKDLRHVESMLKQTGTLLWGLGFVVMLFVLRSFQMSRQAQWAMLSRLGVRVRLMLWIQTLECAIMATIGVVVGGGLGLLVVSYGSSDWARLAGLPFQYPQHEMTAILGSVILLNVVTVLVASLPGALRLRAVTLGQEARAGG